jgi:formylmethanofuran dehydrogenase subunit A
MKISSLPVNVQTQIKKNLREWKKVDATQRAKYYAQNGYSTAAEYHAVILEERYTVEELRNTVLDTMKSRFLDNGFEEWMNMVPNAAWICHQYRELHMGSKAERSHRVQ